MPDGREEPFRASDWPKLSWKCRLRRHKAHRMEPIGGKFGPLTLYTLCMSCPGISGDRSRDVTEGSPEYREAMRDGD